MSPIPCQRLAPVLHMSLLEPTAYLITAGTRWACVGGRLSLKSVSRLRNHLMCFHQAHWLGSVYLYSCASSIGEGACSGEMCNLYTIVTEHTTANTWSR